MISEPVMTSPDRDLAARILERAQLAQMTRNLKLGLSRVSSNSIAMSDNNDTGATNTNKRDKENLSLKGQDTQTPSLCLLESKKRITSIPHDSKETSPLKKHLSVTIKKSNTNSSNNNNNSVCAINPVENIPKRDTFIKPKSPMKNKDPNDSSTMKVPSTPKKSSSNSNSNSNSTALSSSNIHTTPVKRITRISDELDTTDYNSNSHNNIHISNSNSSATNHETDEMINNSTGADLLIYLATSPYSKNDTNSSSKIKIPTTPRTSTFGQLNTDDTIRLSHLKPSLTSPQSTLKNFNYHPNNDMFNKHSINLSPNNMILESPSLYNNNNNSNNSNNINNSNANANNNINNNLLKTPNFNMGDYIHSIFSPSPNINLTTVSKERNIINLKRSSISNSLTQVALLSTSGIPNESLSATITNSINNHSSNNDDGPIKNYSNDHFQEEHLNNTNKSNNTNDNINM